MKSILSLLITLFLLLSTTAALGEEAVAQSEWYQTPPLEYIFVGDGTVYTEQTRLQDVSVDVKLVFKQENGTEISLILHPVVGQLEYVYRIYRDIQTGMYTSFSLIEKRLNPKFIYLGPSEGFFEGWIQTTMDNTMFECRFEGFQDYYNLTLSDKTMELSYLNELHIDEKGNIAAADYTTKTVELFFEELNATVQ